MDRKRDLSRHADQFDLRGIDFQVDHREHDGLEMGGSSVLDLHADDIRVGLPWLNEPSRKRLPYSPQAWRFGMRTQFDHRMCVGDLGCGCERGVWRKWKRM